MDNPINPDNRNNRQSQSAVAGSQEFESLRDFACGLASLVPRNSVLQFPVVAEIVGPRPNRSPHNAPRRKLNVPTGLSKCVTILMAASLISVAMCAGVLAQDQDDQHTFADKDSNIAVQESENQIGIEPELVPDSQSERAESLGEPAAISRVGEEVFRSPGARLSNRLAQSGSGWLRRRVRHRQSRAS